MREARSTPTRHWGLQGLEGRPPAIHQSRPSPQLSRFSFFPSTLITIHKKNASYKVLHLLLRRCGRPAITTQQFKDEEKIKETRSSFLVHEYRIFQSETFMLRYQVTRGQLVPSIHRQKRPCLALSSMWPAIWEAAADNSDSFSLTFFLSRLWAGLPSSQSRPPARGAGGCWRMLSSRF
ncbi:hypothetical protein E2C01_017622 [Portunus trituberculatus]|uniref:Uncharacterized protein n=1 Tax=Portunus trituberculatus TaxID=210409 RepID=A0A5B7DSY9_PORTR|nr:hypothetical protein [Portunus trituberculatus]